MAADMMSQTGRFETEFASKYLQQLCKHFGHKIDVTYDTHAGTLAFPFGPAQLTASDSALEVIVSAADSAGLERARGVIDSHLIRFAFREDFQEMTWS